MTPSERDEAVKARRARGEDEGEARAGELRVRPAALLHDGVTVDALARANGRDLARERASQGCLLLAAVLALLFVARCLL